MKQLFKSFSHEFGTSLNCILSLSTTALQSSSIDHSIKKEYFEKIVKSALILSSIVNDIRDYNHMIGKTFSLTYANESLRQIVADVIYLFKDQLDSKKVRLEHQVQEDIPQEIIIDGQRVKQILVNLMSNATKFTDSGHVKLQANMSKKDNLILTVEDTGIGMSE